MSSAPQTAYRESDNAQSGKINFRLAAIVERSTLTHNRQAVLKCLLKYNRFGTELWRSVIKVSQETGLCRRTVQYHMRYFERPETGILVRVHGANQHVGREFRRSATYRLNATALKPRPIQIDKPHRSAHRAAAPMPALAKLALASAAPVPIASACGVRTCEFRKLTKREREELVRNVVTLMQGRTRDQYGWEIPPGDERYRPPLDQRAAIEEACKRSSSAIPIESALETLKLAGWVIDPPKGSA